jgi:uncharacterized membrane protein YfcA
MFDLLTVFYGCVIGCSLGLTGGGGSIFAVPLLIYGLHVDVREAVGISLAAVGLTAFFGVLIRLKKETPDLRNGLAFALSGMVGAPVGTWLGSILDERFTLQAFAVLMVIVGLRMWRVKNVSLPSLNEKIELPYLWSRKGFAFLMMGLAVGVLSGIFGVGGGFLIVPALTIFGGMTIHRAVATSLMVISLICLSGVGSYLIGGEEIPLRLTGLFVGGGIVGMIGGNWLRVRLSGPALKRIFAAGMWFVAAYVLVKN